MLLIFNIYFNITNNILFYNLTHVLDLIEFNKSNISLLVKIKNGIISIF